MGRLFIKEIQIEKVRHLSDIVIPISPDGSDFKHVIITGKNGSGKTSLLDAIAGHIDSTSRGDTPSKYERFLDHDRERLERATKTSSHEAIYDAEKSIARFENRLSSVKQGVTLLFNMEESAIQGLHEKGECVFAYFRAHRAFKAEEPKQIEKVSLKSTYGINDSPRSLFIKYMLDLKMTQALAAQNGKQGKVDDIQRWFDAIRDILCDIYEDPSLTIEFDEDSYHFFILEQGREPFNFNSASDGFSAVLDIVVDLILRMQAKGREVLGRDLPGIVLIDEIENHLHLSLQRRILPYLTRLFPNVQFVVSTHSPFVLSSMENAIVFDLESKTLVEDGLADSTYEGIVEGYFNVDRLSDQLREKYDRYKALASQDVLGDDELIEIAELEVYLEEIPDYLAFDIATEYEKLWLRIRSKGLAQ